MSGTNATPIPPLQAFSRLSTDAFGGRGSTPTTTATEAALRLLGHYLETQSCNLSEIEAVRQWERQRSSASTSSSSTAAGPTLADAGVDLDTLERLVATRAGQLHCALDHGTERVALLMSAAPPTAAVGRGGATQESSRGAMASVVDWWQLGSASSPWSFALQPPVGSGTLPPPPPLTAAASSEYHFVCLRESFDLIEPFVHAMRCAAALGEAEAVAAAHNEGVAYVVTNAPRLEPSSMFASLELARTYVTLSFRERGGGLAAVERALQACHPTDDLRRVAGLLERVDLRDATAQDTPHPQQMSTDHASGTITKSQAYWSLAVSYAVFFHTVGAYLSGVRGNFEAFATALLGAGDAQQGLSLWGADTFPFLPFTNTESNTAAERCEEAGGGVAGRAPAQVRTRLAALFPASSSHVTGGAADYYVADYPALVTSVLTSPASFSTLLLLSAVATQPLPAVTQRLPRWVELRALYSPYAELEALLHALRDGRLGAAWRCATAAATAYLLHEPHLTSSVLTKLLQEVKRALCFHYLRARGVVDMTRAAQDLCFDAPEEFAEVVTALICDQYVDARIDLVTGTVQLQHSETTTAADGGTAEAVGRAVLGLSVLEMQLTCLSAERNLIFVPTALEE